MSCSDELEELVGVLADVRLGVVAGDVVPLDAVGVEVVQDGQADLVAVSVVRLGSRGFGAKIHTNVNTLLTTRN